MKEEIDAQSVKDEGKVNGDGFYNRRSLPEEEVQKVIFDKQYLTYLEKKLHGEESGLPGIYSTVNNSREKKIQLQ